MRGRQSPGELLRLTTPILTELQSGYEYYQRFGNLRTLLKRTINLPVLEYLGMVVAGDPAHCRKKLATYAGEGVDYLLCAVGAGAAETALTREALTLLAREVIPAFGPCVSS